MTVCVCVGMGLDWGGGVDNEGCLVAREGGPFFGSHSHEQGTSVMAAAEF